MTEQSWEAQTVVPTARWRQALHEDEARVSVGVEYCKYAVVVELRRYVAVNLHLPGSGSSDTEDHGGMPGRIPEFSQTSVSWNG